MFTIKTFDLYILVHFFLKRGCDNLRFKDPNIIKEHKFSLYDLIMHSTPKIVTKNVFKNRQIPKHDLGPKKHPKQPTLGGDLWKHEDLRGLFSTVQSR